MLVYETDASGVVINVGGHGKRLVAIDQSYINENHSLGRKKSLFIKDRGPTCALPTGKGARVVLPGSVVKPIRTEVRAAFHFHINILKFVLPLHQHVFQIILPCTFCGSPFSPTAWTPEGVEGGAWTNTRQRIWVSVTLVS